MVFYSNKIHLQVFYICLSRLIVFSLYIFSGKVSNAVCLWGLTEKYIVMICVILPVCISWESYPRKINQMKCAFCRYPVNSPPQQQKDSPSLKVKSPPVAIISFNTSFTRRLHKTKTSDRHWWRFDLQWWRVNSKDVINWKDPKYQRIVPELFSIVRNLPILHFYLDLKGRLILGICERIN